MLIFSFENVFLLRALCDEEKVVVEEGKIRKAR